MAKKVEVKQNIQVKKDQRQKIIVAEGRSMGTPEIPFKILYTEIVTSATIAKQRVKDLLEKYKETDGLSVNYFSI